MGLRLSAIPAKNASAFKSLFFSCFIALALFTLIGCTGRHRAYSGPLPPSEESAILFTRPESLPGGMFEFTVIITELDGKPAPSTRALKDGSVRLELRPGPHDVKATYRGVSRFGTLTRWIGAKKSVVLHFYAWDRHEYHLSVLVPKGSVKQNGWTAVIYDTSGKRKIVARPIRWEE